MKLDDPLLRAGTLVTIPLPTLGVNAKDGHHTTSPDSVIGTERGQRMLRIHTKHVAKPDGSTMRPSPQNSPRKDA